MRRVLNNILLRFKEDILNKRIGNGSRLVEYKGLEEIKRCLVFWSVNAEQNQWIKQVEICLKNVRIDKLCFVPDDIEIAETSDVVVMRNSDFKFNGKIQNPKLLAMLEREYDLLIDLTSDTGRVIKYVLQNMQVACIASMKKEGAFADIIVDEVTQPLEFIKKLTEILAGINKY